MELTVLKETPDYVVCVKPRGTESQFQMPQLLSRQLGHEPFLPVHRLDKETGGVMVYAKHQQAAAFFSRQIQENGMEKTYLAVIKGCPSEKQGDFEDLLFRDAKRNKSYIVKRERKGVKKASLSYEVVKTEEWNGEPVSLVKIRLHTGRTHQIRVQFSGRNMPVVGDKRYGGRPAEKMALWSASLCFIDPQGEKRCFTSSPPENFFKEI